jgi:ribosome-associated translation inhibitor RaiA/cold shock CspA family protein
MESPLEIVFHNLPPSPAMETEIRSRVAKLEKLYPRLTGCRVSVEALHKQHRRGNVYEVHVEMILPGGELVVSREPHRPKERYASPDAYTSLRDAFKAAESQLKEFKARRQGEVKTHEAAMRGQIAQLYPREDHGFILTNTGTQLYFHRNSVMNDAFDGLKRGDPVHFVETVGDTGPIAAKVWPAAEGGPEIP